jgi:hypothetical protein
MTPYRCARSPLCEFYASRAQATSVSQGRSSLPSQRTLRHAATLTPGSFHSALAGAVAATGWGLFEPVDKRLFRCDYSDITLLGSLVTRGRFTLPAGFAIHALNGAVFGLVFDQVRKRVSTDKRLLAFGMAMAEHVGLYPLSYFVDRYHPARGEEGVPPLLTSGRAFAQATVRHALFGVLLGRLSR